MVASALSGLEGLHTAEKSWSYDNPAESLNVTWPETSCGKPAGGSERDKKKSVILSGRRRLMPEHISDS